jgi:GxxExxY protein
MVRHVSSEWGESAEARDRLEELARIVVDAALEVHRALGPGFVESVYEEALAIELVQRGVPFERQLPVRVTYRGFVVGSGRVDLLVGALLVVELKSVEALAPIHVAQTLSYLKVLEQPLGLLITFNVQLLRDGIRRVVLTRRSQPKKSSRLRAFAPSR